jgi:hypothetical protein
MWEIFVQASSHKWAPLEMLSKFPLPVLQTTICAIHKNFSYLLVTHNKWLRSKLVAHEWMRSNAITHQHSWSIFEYTSNTKSWKWIWVWKMNGLYTILRSLIAHLQISYLSMRNSSSASTSEHKRRHAW